METRTYTYPDRNHYTGSCTENWKLGHSNLEADRHNSNSIPVSYPSRACSGQHIVAGSNQEIGMCTSPCLSFHPRSYSSLCSREVLDQNSGHILTRTRRI